MTLVCYLHDTCWSFILFFLNFIAWVRQAPFVSYHYDCRITAFNPVSGN